MNFSEDMVRFAFDSRCALVPRLQEPTFPLPPLPFAGTAFVDAEYGGVISYDIPLDITSSANILFTSIVTLRLKAIRTLGTKADRERTFPSAVARGNGDNHCTRGRARGSAGDVRDVLGEGRPAHTVIRAIGALYRRWAGREMKMGSGRTRPLLGSCAQGPPAARCCKGSRAHPRPPPLYRPSPTTPRISPPSQSLPTSPRKPHRPARRGRPRRLDRGVLGSTSPR